MAISHAQARQIVERHYPDAKEGSLALLFVETGAIPYAPWPLLHEVAIQDPDDHLALLGYLEAAGPRPSLPGWDRVAAD